MLAASMLADVLGHALLRAQGVDAAGRPSPIGAATAALVLGLVVGNLLPIHETFRPGIRFGPKSILRLGIVLVGIKLSLFDLLKLGAWGLPVVLAAVATGVLFVSWFNRLLGLPPRLGTLIAAGTGICGVTAIVSTAPGIEADEREVAYAIANITLFGLVGMLVYPYLAHRVLHTSEQVGLFLGTAIHDTSQVVGAALAYKAAYHDDVAFSAATVTKLTRNLLLAVVVPVLTLLHTRHAGNTSARAGAPKDGVRRAPLVPMFVVAFVAMSALRSLGDATLMKGRAFGVWDAAGWKSVTQTLGEVWGSRVLLGTALAAVGLGTHARVFRGVGLRPFAVGFAGALVVGGVGALMALTFGAHVRL